MRAAVRAFVASYDVVLAPVAVGAAPLHGCIPGTDEPLESYDVFNLTHTYSVAGLPVAVVPIGADEGLPIGAQIIGLGAFTKVVGDALGLGDPRVIETLAPALGRGNNALAFEAGIVLTHNRNTMTASLRRSAIEVIGIRWAAAAVGTA